MKILYIVRHAKSSWDDPKLADYDRPLNKRGKKDAPLMGKVLKEKGLVPNLLLSSPAKRALSTAKKIAEELGYSKKEILTEEKLYHASKQTILKVVQKQKDKVESMMIVGHNPGLTELASLLAHINIGNIPTIGIVCIEFATDTWKDANQENSSFRFFDYPKIHK